MDPSTELLMIVFFIAGFFISTAGSMIGLGGGFLAVPFLVLIMGFSRPTAVLMSLVMIFFNSASGTVSNVRKKFIDYKHGLLLFIPAVPGLFLGYFLLRNMGSSSFDLIFGTMLALSTLYILFSGKGEPARAGGGRDGRSIPWYGYPISFVAGTVSSTFGIGGGAVYMPLFIGVMRWDIKRSVATSLLLVSLISLFRITIVSSPLGLDPFLTASLCLGAVLGGQAGSKIMREVHGRWVKLALCCSLFLISGIMVVGGLADLF